MNGNVVGPSSVHRRTRGLNELPALRLLGQVERQHTLFLTLDTFNLLKAT